MRRWKLQGIASRVQGKTPMQDLFVILPTGCAPTSLNVCEQTRLSWIQTYASPVALTIRNVTTDNYSHGFQEVRVILWDVKGIWGSSCYRISLILPSRFYSGNIHLVSLPISFFFFFCLTPLSLSLSPSLSLPLSATHPLKQSYPLSLSGSPCLSHSACEASLRGKTRLLRQVI